MFICKERVVREGRLVCFEGQRMSEAEAAALGLVADSAVADGSPKAPTVADLRAELDELGVAYDKRAKKSELEVLLEDAKSAQPAADPDEGDDPSDPDEPEGGE